MESIASLADSDGDPSVPPGKYQLCWASTPSTFRSSIFFWAFQQAFSFSDSSAKVTAGVFRVTGSLPGVQVHSAVQEISRTEIRSIVDLEIWPGFRGDVVSTGRLARSLTGGECGEVRLETTRVERSNYLPVPAVWAVPVGKILDSLANGPAGGAEAKFKVVYCDADGYAMLVPRGELGGDDLFVYERCSR